MFSRGSVAPTTWYEPLAEGVGGRSPTSHDITASRLCDELSTSPSPSRHPTRLWKKVSLFWLFFSIWKWRSATFLSRSGHFLSQSGAAHFCSSISRPLFSLFFLNPNGPVGHFFSWLATFFLKLEAIIEIWALPYRKTQRKTAGGGNKLRFGHFPIGKYKGKPPEAENLWDLGISL